MADSRDGSRIEFVEQGNGPTIVLVPGSFATPAAWRGIRKRLPDGYRTVATSLRGYGTTAETRSLDDHDMAHEIGIVTEIADRVGGPFHLVGHSFGGTVALAAVLSGSVEVRSVATFEANPLALMLDSGSAGVFEATREMSDAFEAAHARGEADAAARIIDFWGNPGSFAAMPEIVQGYCRSTTYANVLDWRTAFRFQARTADYAAIEVPVLLVRGSLANEAMVAITDTLARSLPNARPAVVDGADHFLITTHADECARLLAGFLAEVGS